MSTPKSRPSVRPVKIRVYTRHGKGRIYARVQVVGETHIARGGKVALEMVSQRSGKATGRKDIPIGNGRPGEVFFRTEKVPFGCSAFRATLIDRNGESLETEVLYDTAPESAPWLGSQEGVSLRVPTPWSPVTVRRTRGAMAVTCWGRTYTFRRGSLLSGVTAGGKDLLTGPVSLMAVVDGKAVRWVGGAVEVVGEGPEQVVLSQTFRSSQGAWVACRTEVDFDGMVRTDWRVGSDRVARLDGLTVEVPVRADHAVYQYHFPGRWGEARNVGALPETGLTLGFRPYVWLGDEERGFACFAESDENRHLQDPNRAVEVRRKGDTVLMRHRLVDAPVKLIPGRYSSREFTGWGEEDRRPLTPGGVVTDGLRYTMGFQATPVKPVESDAWDQRIVCIGQGTPGFKPRLRVAESLLDRLVRAGVRAVVIFEHWADAESYVRTPHGRDLQKIVEACHRRGLKVLLYFGFLISDLAEEWRDFGKDSLILPKGGYPLFTYAPQPGQSAWRVCLNSVWQDLLTDGMAKAMDEFDADGVYLDGTEYPFGCCNREHGCGTVRRDGSIAPTYPLFGVRSAMRRIYQIVRSRRPDGLVNVHNSTCMTMPTLGWATSYWDGEQFQGVGKGADVARLLPLDAFRAEFMGRQWGVPAEFLLAGSAYTYEQAWAFSLLHDVPVRPHGPGKDLDLISAVWRVMDDFGRKEAEWLPYWRNRDCVRCGPADAFASLYRHPENGVLAVVSNVGGKAAEVQVSLNRENLNLGGGALRVVDALKEGRVPSSGGKVKLRLKPLEWRLLWVQKG